MEKRKSDHSRLLFGIVLIIIGGSLILGNFWDFSYQLKRYLKHWEVIIILMGLITLITKEHIGKALILLFVGGALYIRHFIEFNFNFWQVFWAALLIFIGLTILLKRKNDWKCHEKCEELSDDMIDETAIFGGGDKNILSNEFKGGKYTAIFGGSTMNLSRTKLSGGINYLDVFIVFGGMNLIVPEDWNIKIKVVSIFGGFSDKKRISIQQSSINESKVLIIKGLVIFGGGEIKSY